jgi:two-component system, OmpR family, sensor kinase
MSRPQLRLGLRGRLTAWIVAILMLAVGASFVAIYRGTGQQLRARLDRDLRAQAGAFAAALPASSASPAQMERTLSRYVRDQPFTPSSQLLYAKLPNGHVVTNEPELLGLPGTPDHEQESPATQHAENAEGRALQSAPPGLSTVQAIDVGGIRLIIHPVVRQGRTIATLGVGEALEPVESAQHGVARTFLLAGLFALAAAVVAGYLVAVGISKPVRRMARTAAAVDAGDLSHRIELSGPRDEIQVLAEAFDHMLDRLDDAFTRQKEFASDASHELRTPLTVLRGQLEVLARQPEVSREDVAHTTLLVSSEIERMERLVDDLLMLARTEEGRPLELREIELRSHLRQLLDGLSLTADRRFVLGEVSDTIVRADPDRLSQVIHNLAQNAVAHTDPGGLVRVSATANGRWVHFEVDDDGPGIPPAQRDRVFDRFHRTDQSRARSEGGSGLGLAITRAIVEAHGGRIRATSSPEGGARIAFDLPTGA